jgi:hypothetical protein
MRTDAYLALVRLQVAYESPFDALGKLLKKKKKKKKKKKIGTYGA